MLLNLNNRKFLVCAEIALPRRGGTMPLMDAVHFYYIIDVIDGTTERAESPVVIKYYKTLVERKALTKRQRVHYEEALRRIQLSEMPKAYYETYCTKLFESHMNRIFGDQDTPSIIKWKKNVIIG